MKLRYYVQGRGMIHIYDADREDRGSVPSLCGRSSQPAELILGLSGENLLPDEKPPMALPRYRHRCRDCWQTVDPTDRPSWRYKR